MYCKTCGAGDPEKTQKGKTSAVAGTTCHNCGSRLVEDAGPKPGEVQTMTAAVAAASLMENQLKAAQAALAKEKAAHQQTREEHDATSAEMLANLAEARKSRDAEIEAHAATKSTLESNATQSTATIAALQLRIDLLTAQMQKGMDAAISHGLTEPRGVEAK